MLTSFPTLSKSSSSSSVEEQISKQKLCNNLKINLNFIETKKEKEEEESVGEELIKLYPLSKSVQCNKDYHPKCKKLCKLELLPKAKRRRRKLVGKTLWSIDFRQIILSIIAVLFLIINLRIDTVKSLQFATENVKSKQLFERNAQEQQQQVELSHSTTTITNQSNDKQQQQQQLSRKLPNGSQCLISPFPQQTTTTTYKHTNGAAISNSTTTTISYLNSLHLRPFKLKSSNSFGHTRGTSQLSSSSSSLSNVGQLLFHVPASNNSVRLITNNAPSLIKVASVNGNIGSGINQVLASSPLIAFESICSIWHNSLQPDKQNKQPAYWVLDRRRAALVAKFDFYTRDEFYDLPGHEAKLTSSPFRPIPPYHFQPESQYYKSCKISFRSYMTLRARLELNFVSVATMVSSSTSGAGGPSIAANAAAAAAAAAANVANTNNNKNKMIINSFQQQESRQFWLLNKHSSDADQKGEQAIWRNHLLELPSDSLAQRRVPYMLEFSAIPTLIKPDSIQQQSYLNGVAIANFTMSPQCFGLQVNESEWQRLRDMGEQIEQYKMFNVPQSSSSSSTFEISQQTANREQKTYSRGNLNDDDNEDNQDQDNNQVVDQFQLFNFSYLTDLKFIEQHKSSILFGVLFLLVGILLASQWLLCTHLHCNNIDGATSAYMEEGQHQRRQNQWFQQYKQLITRDKDRKPKTVFQWIWWKLLDFFLQIFYCICCCFCCCFCLNSCANKVRRNQVYAIGTGQQQKQISNGKQLFNIRTRGQQQHLLLGANGSNNGNSNNNISFITTNHEQHRIQNNYLRPISASIFEDVVELSENPNYKIVSKNNQELLMKSVNNNNQAITSCIKLPANNPLEPYYIDRKRLTLTKPLGKGAFGEVYQGYLVCHCSNDGKTLIVSSENEDLDDSLESHSLKVAVKTLTDERMSEIDFVREAINLSLVSHRNIVELLGVCFDEKPLYIVMEVMPGGNLKNFLVKNRDCSKSGKTINDANQQQLDDRVQLSIGDLLVYALDIARACDYLHKRQFIHRDLAARNCLLSSNLRANCQQTPVEQSNFVASYYSNYLIQTNQNQNNNQNNQSSIASSSAPLLANEQQIMQASSSTLLSLPPPPQPPQPPQPPPPQAAAAAAAGLNNKSSPPSAMDVNANHKVDLEQVYLNGYENSSIVAKLADFGMTRDVYTTDYYRIDKKDLPIRWMPPEAIDGISTSKSDVWSFGIFLWELFSMGQLPYQHFLDNQQVWQFLISTQRAIVSTPKPAIAASSQQPQTQTQTTSSATIATEQEQPLLLSLSARNDQHDNKSEEGERDGEEEQTNSFNIKPPLPPPHDNTPHPIYSIMCACWAIHPDERPQFEEIANRLYWCLQMPDVLATSLPCFYEQTLHTQNNSQRQQQQRQTIRKNNNKLNNKFSSQNLAISQCDIVFEEEQQQQQQQRQQKQKQLKEDDNNMSLERAAATAVAKDEQKIDNGQDEQREFELDSTSC